MSLTTYDIPSLISTPWVLYDISRILKRSAAPFATGIDRIDLQVLQILSAAFGERLLPIARTGQSLAPLDPAALPEWLNNLSARWLGEECPVIPAAALMSRWKAWAHRVRPKHALMKQLLSRMGGEECTYVCCSHSGLATVPGLLPFLKNTLHMQSLIYIHDLIPLEYPEYSRPEATQRFRRMLDEYASLRPDFLVNSHDTGQRLARWLENNHPDKPPETIRGAPPVVDWLPSDIPPASSLSFIDTSVPYFVIVGTIEPRKNHLLLLHIWRQWVEEGRKKIPHLHIVGKRGWENECILDMLERCEAIRPYVFEHNNLSQREMLALVKGAKAMLMPSLAEGLGLPALEACKVGARVLLSDIPVFRSFPIQCLEKHLISPLDTMTWKRRLEEIVF